MNANNNHVNSILKNEERNGCNSVPRYDTEVYSTDSQLNFKPEPILEKVAYDRFVFMPSSEHISPIMEFYKTQERLYWVVEEIKMGKDLDDWKTLSETEKTVIKYILKFFACADGLVIENAGCNFMEEVTNTEIRMYYTKQLSIESVHAETYTMLLNHFITDPKENEELFNAVINSGPVKQKINWAMKWLDKSKYPFDLRLIAMSIVEGVFFSGCFCIIYWFKNKGVLPGLTQSNELISRDEGIHTDFACMVHNKYIVNKTSEKIVHEMMDEAINIEIEFVEEMFIGSLNGMDKHMMVKYIKFIGNRLLRELGYAELYKNVSNPFPFMLNISLECKTNVFEKETTEYKNKSGNVTGLNINLDADI